MQNGGVFPRIFRLREIAPRTGFLAQRIGFLAQPCAALRWGSAEDFVFFLRLDPKTDISN